MSSLRPGNGRSRERGVALIVTMMVTLAITALSFTAAYMASNTVKASQSYTDRQTALYAAETGLQRAIAMLTNATSWNELLKNGGASTGGIATAGDTCSCSNETTCVTSLTDALGPRVPTATSRTTASARGVVLFDSGNPYKKCQLNVAYTLDPTTAPNVTTNPVQGVYSIYIRNNIAEVMAGNATADADSTIVIRVVGQSAASLDTALPGTGRVILEAAFRRGGGGSTRATYGGINENAENSNSITSNLDLSSDANIFTGS